MATVAVTGAGGFIGSHVVERLLSDGHRVRAFVRYTSTSAIGFLEHAQALWPDRLEIVRGTIEDPGASRELVANAEVVIHLAALVGIPFSYVAPHHYVMTNVVGTVNLLEACRIANTERVVYVSTSEIYGRAAALPIEESEPARAQSPYAATKAGAEQIALSYHRSFGLPAVVVRPFNTFGPRQSARALIPSLVTQALNGDVLCLGAIEPRRDFTFVSDTVAGIVAAGFAPDVVGEVMNLGTGTSRSVAEVADMIIERVNPTARIEVDHVRVRPEASEIPELRSDPGRAVRLMGYHPRVTFEEGLDTVIADLRANLKHYPVGEYVV